MSRNKRKGKNMSSNKIVDLGEQPIVLGLGSGLRDSAGGFCKCGRFSSQLDHGLCIYCRAGGTSPVVTPTSIPTPKKGS